VIEAGSTTGAGEEGEGVGRDKEDTVIELLLRLEEGMEVTGVERGKRDRVVGLLLLLPTLVIAQGEGVQTREEGMGEGVQRDTESELLVLTVLCLLSLCLATEILLLLILSLLILVSQVDKPIEFNAEGMGRVVRKGEAIKGEVATAGTIDEGGGREGGGS
jgi:hypothetical protein